MKFVVLNLVAVLALQLVSADHGTGTCDGLDHLIENVDPILGQCTRDTECTQVSCSGSQTVGVPDATITLLPCNVPPAINIFAISGGIVVGNYTTSTNAADQPLTVGGTTVALLDWIVAYNSVNMEFKIQINGSVLPTLNMKSPLINETIIPTVCAGTTPPPTTTNVGPTSDSLSCDGLSDLTENADPILGLCTRDAQCTQISCSGSQTVGVPDATITLLPCNEPPAINIVAIAAAGDVIGNYTTSTNAVDQPLATPEGITLVRLDWIVTYNSVNMGLKIQINGSLFPALDMKVPLFNTTTILIDTSVCAGAPKLQFMLAGLIASLLVAMLV
ncbi:uncharacterized protein LOC135349962 isoform X1 [Halichondria panicea]|uniref:uncharacterized protein LOC135349962 isoform X1 n=1 Tax=Halichondria panicea TaxID=6063 RepID=UPI00312BBD34